MKTRSIPLVAGLVAGAFALSLSAHAGTLGEKETRSFSIAGIDLNSEAGAQLVFDRIENTADRVCGVKSSNKQTLREMQAAKDCAAEAVKTAVETLNAEKVTALYEQS